MNYDEIFEAVVLTSGFEEEDVRPYFPFALKYAEQIILNELRLLKNMRVVRLSTQPSAVLGQNVYSIPDDCHYISDIYLNNRKVHRMSAAITDSYSPHYNRRSKIGYDVIENAIRIIPYTTGIPVLKYYVKERNLTPEQTNDIAEEYPFVYVHAICAGLYDSEGDYNERDRYENRAIALIRDANKTEWDKRGN